MKGHDRRESVHLGSVWCVCSSAHVTILCDSSVLPLPSFFPCLRSSVLPSFLPSCIPSFLPPSCITCVHSSFLSPLVYGG